MALISKWKIEKEHFAVPFPKKGTNAVQAHKKLNLKQAVYGEEAYDSVTIGLLNFIIDEDIKSFSKLLFCQGR